MSAHVLLNLSNVFGKREIKCKGYWVFYPFSEKQCYINTNTLYLLKFYFHILCESFILSNQ